MTFGRNYMISFPYIIIKGTFDLITEVNHNLITAFSGDADPVIFKVNVIQIKADTFRNTYTGTKH